LYVPDIGPVSDAGEAAMMRELWSHEA